MTDAYIPVEGTRDDITDSDYDLVKAELSSVNFEISYNASTYSLLLEISSYISNLFKAYEEAKKLWFEPVNGADVYHEAREAVPLPEAPKETSLRTVGLDLSGSTSIEKITTSNQGYYKGYINIATGTLSVRNSPNGEVISNLNKYQNIKVLNPNDNGWAVIEVNGEKGYVPSKNIKIDSNLIQTAKIMLNGDTNLYYKLEANENSENYLPMMNEQSVNILEYNKDSEWSKVEMLGKEVFVKSKYLKLD